MNFDDQPHDDKFSSQYIDLLSERVGGKALYCSDEWFAPASNLVKFGRGVMKPGHFVDTGQWMDGWESRRSYDRKRPNNTDHDFCVLKLGIPGIIHGVDVDTNHFRGNAPEFVSIEAAVVKGEVNDATEWVEILSKTATTPHSQHLFDINSDQVWTHLRLNIFPDGGVARLRAYGEPVANPDNYIDGELIDLAYVVNGGRALICSDMFFSSGSNMLMPNRGVNMGDGWETKRRRDQDNDWAIVKLGLQGSIRKVILDTAHFKGNFPDRFSLQAVNMSGRDVSGAGVEWQTIIPQTKLHADQEHLFISEITAAADEKFTHVRLNIFPDGGVSRLRIFGFPVWPSAEK